MKKKNRFLVNKLFVSLAKRTSVLYCRLPEFLLCFLRILKSKQKADVSLFQYCLILILIQNTITWKWRGTIAWLDNLVPELFDQWIEQQFGLSKSTRGDPPVISTNLVSTYMIFHYFTLVDSSFHLPVLF